MNILVISQYYYPEPFKVTDICEELVKQGHNVTVVSGVPNYPMGKFYQGYKNKHNQIETINGVNIYRCFTVARKKGVFKRFLNYYSYVFSSIKFVKNLKEDFDVVLVYQLSPVIMANAGVVYKKIHNKKLLLYCLDLWPESLIAGGIKRNSAIYKLFDKISNRVYNHCDKILITSRMFKDYFVSHFGIDEEKISYLPQYAEVEYGFKNSFSDKNTFDFMFAGNIGTMQSVITILEAALILKNDKRIKFHIVGDGIQLENCKKFAYKNNIDNVCFYGRKPLNEMPNYYAKADAMLVTLKSDRYISRTLPGKVQSCLAAGKPIIAAIDGATEFLINDAKCGFCSPAENATLLANSIKKFCNLLPEERNKMAENSKKYYEINFNKELFFKRLVNELEQAVTIDESITN